MVVESIGYECENIEPDVIKWDEKKSTIANENGCVISSKDSQKIEIGKYTSGWVKSGPKGIIDQTMIGSMVRKLKLNLQINKIIIGNCEQFRASHQRKSDRIKRNY